MAGSKVPADSNMTPEVRRFLDDRAKAETAADSRLAALEALTFASTAEAQAGTVTNEWMAPDTTKAAILANNAFLKLAHYQEQQTAGTDGGGFTSGSWQTRVLNTEVYDNIGITLSSNQLTLPAGTYFIDAQAPAFHVRANQARLYNATDSAVILYGTVEHATDGATGNESSASQSRVRGRFVLSSAKAVRIEHRCADTQSTDGFGRNTNFGGTEIYTDIVLWKLD